MIGDSIVPKRTRRIPPHLDLVPMIDTILTLLLFFAVAIMLVGGRAAIPVHLPSAQSAEPVHQRVILMLPFGKPVQVNGKDVTTDQIGAALKQAAGGNLDTQIVVMADEKVPYAQLVAVIDQARLADFTRIALATAPAGARGQVSGVREELHPGAAR
jgi:biopolymer transport protein ExbD